MNCGILLPWPQQWKHKILTSRPPGNSLKFAIFFSILSFSTYLYFDVSYSPWWASQVTLVVKNLPANAGDIRDADSIPGWGRSPGGGHSNPLQYLCLENPMDRGVWWAVVHGVTKSWTQLKQLSTQAFTLNYLCCPIGFLIGKWNKLIYDQYTFVCKSCF